VTQSYDLTVNGQHHTVAVDGQTPLLYVLRNDLALNGAKFGCGLGQCGACTVNIGGEAVRSCITPVEAVAGRPVTTIESTEGGSLAALQQAFVAEQAMQCGYCINGMIMQARPFLDSGNAVTDAAVRDVLALNLCRCGAHNRIVRAVVRAAKGLPGASGT
jgi:nicotinate dehydrogenase subunit A